MDPTEYELLDTITTAYPEPDRDTDEGYDNSPWGLGPQMALRLIFAGQLLADNDYPQGFPIGENPDPVLTARCVQCFRDLVGRLSDPVTHGDGQLPRCTGDEIALWTMIDVAEGIHIDEDPDPTLDRFVEDVDFDYVRDACFEDHDFRFVVDGVTIPAAVQEANGMTNLDPSQWFLPFRP